MPHWTYSEEEYQEAVTARRNAEAELALVKTQHKAANERMQREHDADMERRNREEEARSNCMEREHKAELAETKSKHEAEIECQRSKIEADAAKCDDAIAQLKAKIVLANDKLENAKEHREEEKAKLSREIDKLKKEKSSLKKDKVILEAELAAAKHSREPERRHTDDPKPEVRDFTVQVTTGKYEKLKLELQKAETLVQTLEADNKELTQELNTYRQDFICPLACALCEFQEKMPRYKCIFAQEQLNLILNKKINEESLRDYYETDYYETDYYETRPETNKVAPETAGPQDGQRPNKKQKREVEKAGAVHENV